MHTYIRNIMRRCTVKSRLYRIAYSDAIDSCRTIPHGLRIAIAADLHSRDGSAAIAEIAGFSPDLILAPGDIMNGTDKYAVDASFNQNGFTFLKKCRGIAPVFYSLGNHERGMTEENSSILSSCGIELLSDRITVYSGIIIAGLSSGYKNGIAKRRVTPEPDLRLIDELRNTSGFRILLSHHPEYYRKYLSSDKGTEKADAAELVVSGHAHGGQWRLPFGPGIYAPGQGIFPKYTGGVHESKNGGRLVISRGMANTVIFPRLFNPCEIVFLEIK